MVPNKVGTQYLPVSITFNETRPEWRYSMHWYKKDFNEHTEKYHQFYYPYLLVSPFVTGMSKSREKDFPQAKYIVSDSGGFQIASHRPGVKISVLDVLRWQESIADVAFTVDYPAYSYESDVKGHKYYTDDYFERCMKVSNENAWKMLEAQENQKMELWAVVQGGNYKDLKKWYNNLTANHQFKGYALPLRSTFMPCVKDDFCSQLQFAKEVGTNFHFLGRCEPLAVIVIAKLAQITKKFYTYDTASAAGGLMLGKYHDPMFLSSLSFSKKKPEQRVNFDLNGPPPCDCPVCQKHTVKEMIEGYYTLLLHNVYVRNRFNDYINVMVQDDNIFNDLINKFTSLSRYQKNKSILKDKINALIFDEKRISGGIESYF